MVSAPTSPPRGHPVAYGGFERPSPLPAPPTQARGVEKRDRLYEAAISRYRQAGIASTRVEDIIADAGVSWATFFRYFPRKEDVLLEGAARHFRNHVVPVSERGLGDRRLRVRTVIQRTLAALLRPGELPPELHTAALLEVFAHPARFAAFVQGRPQPVIALMAALLAEGQRRGEIRSGVDTGLAAVSVSAGCMFPAAQAAAAGADPVASVTGALGILWGGLEAREKGLGSSGTQ